MADDERRDDIEAVRSAAKRVLEADMRGVRDLDALNALEDAAGFSQQGQRRVRDARGDDEAIAICQNPNGDGLYVPAADIRDGRCFEIDCDCTPKVYVPARPPQGEGHEALMRKVEERRNDPEFMARIARIMREEADTLDLLARPSLESLVPYVHRQTGFGTHNCDFEKCQIEGCPTLRSLLARSPQGEDHEDGGE